VSLVLYDDARARSFEPFALTRPASELRAGVELVRRRWQSALGARAVGLLAAPHLEDFSEGDAPPVLTGRVPAGTIVANSRCAVTLDSLPPADVWRCGGRVAAVRLRAELRADDFADGTRDLESLLWPGAHVVDEIGWWHDEVWDLVKHLSELLAHDIESLAEATEPEPGVRAEKLGPYPAYVERGARVEPYVVFDCQAGPILVRSGATISSFTRLVGPCAVGHDSQIMGGRIAASSIGEQCKVAGDVSVTTFIGHANKGHEGFVGHSVVGRWANLGASTVTSNLKNTYGRVSLWTVDGMRETDLQFLGTLMGDHAKTGIGTRLTTGTVVGAGANVVGGEAPKVVPPFAWGVGGRERYDIERFLTVAERVMARRQVALDDATRRALRCAYERATAPEYAARWEARR
jgi:UDP-N-acetylglucosamine diphosphorylase/glucosamine-1-phosphate N-acetyltransferase